MGNGCRKGEHAIAVGANNDGVSVREEGEKGRSHRVVPPNVSTVVAPMFLIYKKDEFLRFLHFNVH